MCFPSCLLAIVKEWTDKEIVKVRGTFKDRNNEPFSWPWTSYCVSKRGSN